MVVVFNKLFTEGMSLPSTGAMYRNAHSPKHEIPKDQILPMSGLVNQQFGRGVTYRHLGKSLLPKHGNLFR